MTVPILVLLTVLMAAVLWPRKRHEAPTFRVAPRADAAHVVIRRSYGLERPRAAPEPEAHRTTGKDVTFADEAPETGLPQWDGLDTGPVCALGQEREDGTPCEVLLPPTEATETEPQRAPVLEAMSLTDDLTVEEIPLPDMTDEERQALAAFNAGAFR